MERRWGQNQLDLRLQISRASECFSMRDYIVDILTSEQQDLGDLGSRGDHFCDVEVTTTSELGEELSRVVKFLSFSALT
eukprot:760865-Hanusia_phi.AAC.4